jgi:hypothetical protein
VSPGPQGGHGHTQGIIPVSRLSLCRSPYAGNDGADKFAHFDTKKFGAHLDRPKARLMMWHSRRAGEGLPVVAALVLLGAVCFTLTAAHQWTMFAARDWRSRILTAGVAIILWLVWFYGTNPHH